MSIAMFANASNSDCLEHMFVNPLTRSADVQFQDGSIYHYENISLKGCVEYVARSITSSLGGWVNEYLVNPAFPVNSGVQGTTYEFIGFSDED